MPTGFWNDDDGSRYHAAYFDRFEGIWCHGDWVELTERGGMIIYGRSDAVLNPGGVRIGTADRLVQCRNLIVEILALLVEATLSTCNNVRHNVATNFIIVSEICGQLQKIQCPPRIAVGGSREQLQ